MVAVGWLEREGEGGRVARFLFINTSKIESSKKNVLLKKILIGFGLTKLLKCPCHVSKLTVLLFKLTE